MANWISRYLEGDRVRVWAEMTGVGSAVRSSDWEDAVAVTRETMRRARANVETLVELLPSSGFEFENSPESVFQPARSTATQELDRLEAQMGALPLALRCWFEEVGQVNLLGRNTTWNFDLTDPLVVEAPADYIESEYQLWLEDRGAEWGSGPFEFEIAPDYLHKANISGGSPYAMEVPNDGVDGLLLWEPHQTTFVNYLRVAFKWAGLPGWDNASGHGWSAPPAEFPTVLRRIADRLLPL